MSGLPNPFRPAEQVAPKVKCLIYGASGIGKTYLALTSPGRIAVIDTEGGTAFYADRVGAGGLHPFDVLPTKTFAQVEQAVTFLRDNPGQYETLVIDPVTVLYETLQDAAQVRRIDTNRRTNKNTDDPDLEMLDWQRIKRAYKRLMTDLVNLPMHVVVTAREGELTEKRGSERVHSGWKPDAEKSTAYYFDTVIRLVPAARGREAQVEKDRTGTLPHAKVASPSFDKLFARALKSEATGSRSLQSDDEAAHIDANSTMVAAELEERDEILTERGDQTHVGAIARGDGRRSDLEARQMADGWHIGFCLALDATAALAQVVAQGRVGTELYEHTGYDTARLYGQKVTCTGRVVKVDRPGKSSFFRMYLARIEGDGWVFPVPEPVAAPEPEPDTLPLGLDAEDEQAVGEAMDAALGVGAGT